MNVESYRRQRQERIEAEFQPREICRVCWQPTMGCFCQWVKPVHLNGIRFVILIHPIEARRRIATGRLSHLCLPNSQLIRGHDFSNNKNVNAILSDPNVHPVILYPGRDSSNLSQMSQQSRADICPPEKTLTIFVLDGTWATAKKMLKHSSNLRNLPRLCFTREAPSDFRLRKQPRESYLSTIEAIHHTIELLGPSFGFRTESKQHDLLLEVFNSMVELHLDFIKRSHERQGPSRYQLSREVGSGLTAQKSASGIQASKKPKFL